LTIFHFSGNHFAFIVGLNDYSRFFHKLLRDFGLVNCDEPYKKLLTQGMVLADAYYYEDEKSAKIWISPNDAIIQTNDKGKVISAKMENGQALIFEGMCKMSKSKNNGIKPYLVSIIFCKAHHSLPAQSHAIICEKNVSIKGVKLRVQYRQCIDQQVTSNLL
jgi:hypothetical protein